MSICQCLDHRRNVFIVVDRVVVRASYAKVESSILLASVDYSCEEMTCNIDVVQVRAAYCTNDPGDLHISDWVYVVMLSGAGFRHERWRLV